jgi:hypothetical protein
MGTAFVKCFILVIVGDDSDDILVYGQISEALSPTADQQITIKVARLLPTPIRPRPRLPRPDDPLPRCELSLLDSISGEIHPSLLS